jgi:hypothetical protein
MDDSQKRKSRLEIGHVLFIDVAGYSKLTTEDESEALPELNRIVRNTEAVRDAERANVAYAQGENHFVVAHPMPTGGTTRIRV